ncbi:CBO0543 family protein [Paenibacillus puerhi]|uniref:CBO0543 family protein n=1 Tax=Paenibacillus puerhi TaxID=2692622 RepID=UPI00135A92A3|nr:CBO0543 family protein [Paenibacillus puerhi]
MHVCLAVFSAFAAWKWADWRHWKHYQSTMLYITVGGMLYEYLTDDRNLWVFHPDFLYNQRMTVLVYAVLTMPLNVLIFLSTLPRQGKLRIVLHIMLWVAIYAAAEGLLQMFGRIQYAHGWTFWHSVWFDLIMFPMLLLHHKRPGTAYILSLFIIGFLMLWFKVQL